MRSALHNTSSNPNSSFSNKIHKDLPSFVSPTPLIFHQARSPKVINQIIYEPIQLSKSPQQYSISLQVPHSIPSSSPQPITDNTIQQLMQKIKKYQEQQRQLRFKLQYLQHQNQSLSAQINILQSKNNQSDIYPNMHTLTILQKQKQELIKCNTQYQQQMKILLDKLSHLTSMIEKQQKQKSNQNKQTTSLKLNHIKNIEQLQEEIQQLIVELEQRNVKQKDMEMAINNMMVENRMLNKYLRIKEGEIVENNEIKKSCEDRIKKLQKVIEELVKVKEGMDVINKIKNQFQELNFSLSNMRQILASKQNDIKLLKQEIEYYKNNIRVIISEKNDLMENVKELSRIVEIEKCRNFIKENKKNKIKYKQQFESRIKELVGELSKLKVKIEEDAKIYEYQIKNISIKKQESDIEIVSLSTNLSLKSMEVKDKYRIINELEQQLTEVKKQNKEINYELNKIKIDHQKANVELRYKTSHHQQILRKVKHEYQNKLKQKLQPYVYKIQILQQQLQKSKSRTLSQEQTILRNLNNSQSFDTNVQPRLSSIIISNNNNVPPSFEDRYKLTELKSQFFKQKTVHLEHQIEITSHANATLKQTINKLSHQIEYLKKELLNHSNQQSQLLNIQQRNIDSQEQINCLKNDITKTNKILLHKQSSLSITINELKEQVENKDIKIKQLNNRLSISNTQIQSLQKQLQLSLTHSSSLSQQKSLLTLQLQYSTKQIEDKDNEIDQYKINIERIEECNSELYEAISKLKIEMHMKVIELVGCKDELEVVKCMNKGLNERIQVLSNQLIANSSNRMREIMEMHSNVETMVASLEMFQSKDSSFD